MEWREVEEDAHATYDRKARLVVHRRVYIPILEDTHIAYLFEQLLIGYVFCACKIHFGNIRVLALGAPVALGELLDFVFERCTKLALELGVFCIEQYKHVIRSVW